MAVFSDLSVELIVKILFETQPLDLVSFAAVSKQIHLLATPIITEDKQLQKKYTCIFVHHDSEYMFLDHQVAKLLIAIIQNPRVALNIVKAIITIYYPKDENCNHPPYASDMFKQLEELIRRTSMVPVDQMDEWVSAVCKGDEDPLFALLLLHLPNLQRLTIECRHPNLGGKFLETVHRISEAERQSYLLQLRKVYVYYTGYADQKMPDLPYAFMSLPSVQSFGTENLYGPGSSLESTDPDNGPCSQLEDTSVKDSIFNEGYLRTEHLCEIIQKTRCLRSLDWQRCGIANPSGTFVPSHLTTSLVANASHTLERLALRTDGCIATSLGSLQELRSLREIDVDIAMIFDVKGNDILTWPSRLPFTLEKLSLNLMDDHPVQTPENFCEAFRCLLRVRKGQTPSLKYICIRMRSENHCRKAYDHIQHPFSAAGIYLRHDHRTGGGHMDPGCGDCGNCNLVVERFLCETGGPEACSTKGCCTP